MKKKVFILMVIAVSVIAIVSTSYGYLKAERVSDPNQIALSNFGVILLNDMTSVSMDNLYPVTDEEGLNNTKTTFQIQNTGSITAGYKISLVDDEVKSTMSNSDVRYQLKRTSSKTGTTETLEIKNVSTTGLIDEGTIEVGEILTYELILWIDYDANPNNQTFSKVVLVEGMQVSNLDKSGANFPEMADNMIPVYYDKITDTEGVWRKADSKNLNPTYQWFDYDNYMWANAVTVKDNQGAISDITGNVNIVPNPNYTLLDDGSISFDGVDDYLNLGYANYDFGNTVSVVARFKVSSFVGEEMNIIGNQEYSGFALTIINSKITFALYDNNITGYRTIDYDSEINKNIWYTVVGTYDGSNMNLYVNGSLVDTLSVNLNFGISTMPITLGTNPESTNFQWLSGVVSDAMLYDDVLIDSEISSYFSNEIVSYPSDNQLIVFDEFKENENEMIVDKTGNVAIAIYNATLLEDGSVSFNGVYNYLKLGYENYDFENTISVVVRFKVSSFLENEYETILCNAESAGFSLELYGSRVNFALHQSNVGYLYASYNVDLKVDTWYTVVATYDGSNLKIYVNNLEGTTDIGGQAITTSIQPITLGGNPNQNTVNQVFNGTISDTFVYTDVLTETEISKYFKGEITSYPEDNLLIGFDEFTLDGSKRQGYLNADEGTEVNMDDITTMWVWIPRYKYTMFTGLNKPSEEQQIDITFEHGIDKTGTVKCVDNILTANDSSSSETCTDDVNGSIIKGKSTYTHPAFTFGDEELTGFWMAKFEMSTDDETCINNKNETNCNKTDLNILVKPSVDALSYQSVSTEFASIRNMETYNNIHGFPQSEKATSYLDKNGYLTGEINNDNNNLDIHMQKNMEWGAVAYLSQSQYGKWSNPLYSGDYRRVYKNNYYNSTNYAFKTGYSGGNYNSSSSTSTAYNDMTIVSTGQGYRGAGASTTGTVYGVYDMNGGLFDYVMGNMVNSSGSFYASSAGIWGTSASKNIPIAKYYDKYSYSLDYYTLNSQTRGKLGDATKETINIFNLEQSGGWGGVYMHMPYATGAWFKRGGCDASNTGIFYSRFDPGWGEYRYGTRPVLSISREFPWLSE